jgi:uncharacterized membrane protein (DUF485 family)
MFLYILLLLFIVIPAACAFFIANRVFTALKKKESSYTWPVSIFVFILSGALLLFLIAVILTALGAFGR